MLSRFRNKALGDTIFRVGCDLTRKLGPEDRLAGAIRYALEYNLPYDKILFALICGCHFKAKDEGGNLLHDDKEFISHFGNNIKKILTDVCCFDEIQHKPLFNEAEKINKHLSGMESGKLFSKFKKT